MNNIEFLKNGIEGFNIDMNDSMLEKFKIYREILVDWNKKMNFIGIEDEKEVYIKYFLDFILVVKNGYIKNGMFIIDVGIGVGFFGILLKICLDSLEFILLDLLNKRINFLEEVSRVLELDNIIFIYGRVEDFGKNEDYREKYDVVMVRVVVGLLIFMEFCVLFVKVGGYFICLKGLNVNLELEEL